MALPTAPLGQLPNMNMPYSIPTYDKGPSIWEKALASFLVSAAGNVATQGVENAMSRDYAPEFGEEKAGGLSKLVSGPKVGKEDAKTRRQQAFVRDENEASRLAAQGQSDADAMNALLRQDRQLTAGRESDELRLLAQQGQSDADTANAALRQERDATNRTALARLEAELYGQRPDVLSQVDRDRAAAAESNSQTEFRRSIMGSIPKTGGTERAAAAPTSPVDQVSAALSQERALTPEQRALIAFLDSPQGRAKYPTGSDVMGKLTLTDLLRLIPPPEAY